MTASKNKPAMTADERRYVERVRSLPCSVCDWVAPSEAHEIKQGSWYTSVALCKSCHRCPKNGIHGEKVMWKIMHMSEIDALNVTIGRLMVKVAA
mgnify:CR=1 FL=1